MGARGRGTGAGKNRPPIPTPAPGPQPPTPIPMNPYLEYENETSNRPRPAGFEGFAKEIERLGNHNNVRLRLVWAPEVIRFLWGAERRVYAFKQERRHTGWLVGPMEEFNGALIHRPHSLRKPDAFRFSPEGAHRLDNGDWVKPDFRYWEVAHPRFMIEEMLDPGKERPEHERHRYEYLEETNELVDALGPYPQEGKWACIHVIAAHAFICCRNATQRQQFCYGTGRDPGGEDLAEIESRIQARNQRRRVEDHYAFESEFMREYTATMARIKKGQERAKQNYYDILKQEIDPVFSMIGKARSKLPPFNHQKAGVKTVRLLDQHGRELPTGN